MKILINRISPRISGAEVYNIYLLKALKKYKDLEIIFSSDNKELNRRIENMGVMVRSINPGINEIGTKKQFLFALFMFPLYLQRYLKFFKELGKIDLIILESMTEKIFLTPILKLMENKVIWIEHGPLFQTQRAAIIKTIYKWNTHFVNKIICVSKSTQDDLLSNGIQPIKTLVVYIGVDTKLVSPLDQKEAHRIKSDLRLIGKDIISFLGTVNKEKGIEDFLEVATLLSKEKRDINFLVIGEGELLEWVKSEILKRDISSRFHFTGFINDVRKYLGITDLLLFPSSHAEGLSIALLEANAMGVPSIATNIGGNKEIIINRKNGLLYKNSSVNKIKDLVLEILRDKKEYKINARRVALDTFSLEQNAENFYQLFNSIQK